MLADELDDIVAWKIQQWIGEDVIKERSDGMEHEWIMPTFPWIDQLKEAQAHELKVKLAFETHGQVCKSQNKDRETVIKARDLEIRDSIERAANIKKDTGVEVPWQLFAGLEVDKAALMVATNNDRKNDSENQNDADDN